MIRSVWGGICCTVLACALALVYVAATWQQPHRAAIAALVGGAVAVGGLAAVLPLHRLAGRRREVAFTAAWNLGVVFLIAGGAALDGGVESPLAYLGFVPLVFASVSYSSTWLVASIAIADILSFVAVAAAAGGMSWSRMMLFLGTLTIVAGTCVWQTSQGRRQRRELARVSRTDPLTGCLNRRGLEERLDMALARARADQRTLAVIHLDFDGFKSVNDTHGHAAGDALLVEAVRRMLRIVRDGDLVGRMGGDEFAVIAFGADADVAESLARRVEETIAPTEASVGVAMFPRDGSTPDDLHRAADKQMYAVKRMRAAVA